jgi:hypothetical protein
MSKRPGSRIPIERLQTLLPLTVYALATAALVWSAILFATSVVFPLTNPKPLDASTILRKQESVNAVQYRAATEHFPGTEGAPKAAANPFGR